MQRAMKKKNVSKAKNKPYNYNEKIQLPNITFDEIQRYSLF